MKKWFTVLMLLLAFAGTLCWWQRAPLLAWYYVKQLAVANQESVAVWAKRVAGLDTEVVSRLLERLQDSAESACNNIGAGLACLGQRWGADDARTLDLAESVQGGFSSFSPAGRAAALVVTARLLRCSEARVAPARLTCVAGALLTSATSSAEMRGAALILANALIEHAQPGQWQDLCTDLARQGLQDADQEHRLQAVNLVLHPPLQTNARLLSQVVPLLHDAAAEVRRAAVVAVGPARETISDDDLLPLLHDRDAEVRRLCAEALRTRGLREEHILLARLISAEQAAARLEVVDHLQDAADLEPGVWLRRLSQDPAPAVRAAAIRAAYFQTSADLRDRLQQMAQTDPSPTVRQLAVHYLMRPRGMVSGE